MTCPKYWHEAKEYLAKKDAILASLMTSYPSETIINYYNPFLTLANAIIGQQISVTAATTVSQRVKSLLGDITIKNYLEADQESLRQCGLSGRKISYITNIAQAFEQGVLTPQTWQTMSDQEVIKQLTSIKGIGPWTAQMFLIFHLHRKDIFPMADLGLINAIQRHYSTETPLTKEQIVQLSQQWKPYRTVATWYLWRSLDPASVQY
ncbi:DNA-3-methyladenine glycosylase [Cyanothece sp. BG0011]|uniref:DNA-3-methyladenine glycosylase family protein n=1 Tax=Cyanothece sp. BG0011 TaxID=2082950 RepID=UPI000D1F46E1|nr:DNA-3-methyladenine glycosylase [Cyanothece sp. BG0011]